MWRNIKENKNQLKNQSRNSKEAQIWISRVKMRIIKMIVFWSMMMKFLQIIINMISNKKEENMIKVSMRKPNN